MLLAVAATASTLPSTLQVAVVKPVSMTLVLGLFTLALLTSLSAGEELTATWVTPPSLETFSSYEDMQRYFDHRNQRRLRHLENPLEDSYIEAYNRHNEHEEHRAKRSAAEHQEFKQQPALIRFEMTDAVEPSDEVKDLIRQYKSREFQQNKNFMETVPPGNSTNLESLGKPIVKRASANNIRKQKPLVKHLARPKRSMQHKQPANFKVKYIPFEASDAREPDAHTKILIKRMRALEIERLAKELPLTNPSSETKMDPLKDISTTTKKPQLKRSKLTKQWKPKRVKREASPPEMIKFEISDAKDPDPSLKTFMQTKATRESKDLKLDSIPAAKTVEAGDLASSDQSAQSTNKFLMFQEAPIKVKKSIAAIPHDVQNIISHLIKGGGGGKAYLKYIPAKQMDYNNLKVSYPIAKGGGAIYGHGGGGGGGVAYGKYAHAVPVKFVYHPVAVGAIGGHGGGYAGAGGGHEVGGGGAAVAVPVKYVGVGGGEGGHRGGYAGGHGGGYAAQGGGRYEAAGADVKYVAAVGGKGSYGEGGGYVAGSEVASGGGGHESGYASGGEGAAVDEGGGYEGAAAVAEGAYGGGVGEDEGEEGAHGGGYPAAGGSYGLVHGAGLDGHANYGKGGSHGSGVGYLAPAAAAIAHPIVVAEPGGVRKAESYGGGYAEAGGAAKNAGNEVIKAIPAPQFKGEIKYSVVPTVEQYAKTATQDFQLKLYSPESLIAKAQLEAKDKAKAIAEEGQKAVAAAYNLAGGKGGGKGGSGEGGFGFKIGAGYKEGEAAYEGGRDGGSYGGLEGGFGVGKGGSGLGGKGGAGFAGGYEGGGGGYASGKTGAGYGGGSVAAGPVIKIEYHAPAESFKGNYKDIPEFQQLSSLVGKSPEDQIHGLTYLLAKEMQNRLHLQRQHNFGGGKGIGGIGVYGASGESAEARPQDNKAPVMFEPQEATAVGGGEASKGAGGGGGDFYQPIVGKYIGMAKSKQYIPIVEQAAMEEDLKGGSTAGLTEAIAKGGLGGGGGGGLGGKLAYSGYGLSPNYKGLGGLKGVTSILGAKGVAAGRSEGYNDKTYKEAAAKLQSYASKYAFGYRIRDFNTGNDFGHKQNRDLHGVTRGQYHILLPDGRIQNVIYHADDTGFHADVSFESGR